MNINKTLAAVASSRVLFDKTKDYIGQDELGPVGNLILSKISEFYEADPAAKSADLDIVLSRLERETTNPKHAETFRAAVKGIKEVDASAVNVVAEVLAAKKHALGMKLSSALMTNKESEIDSLLSEYQLLAARSSLEDDEDEGLGKRVFTSFPVTRLMAEKLSADNLIKLAPTALNKRVDGGALPGHHILIYGRPESGKSLVSINMLCGFLKQGYKVLYCGNEDPAEQMIGRIVSRLSGMNKYEVAEDPEKAEELCYKNGYERLVFAEIDPGTEGEVASLVEDYEPDIVIVDQIRNLEMKAESRVNQLEAAAVAMRKIAKKYGVLVVSVTQAGDSAEQKLVLGQGDVDFSNTGIPAQVDLMVGVGVTDEWDKLNQRMISLPKNKLSGKHDYFPIAVDPQLSKAVSMDNE